MSEKKKNPTDRTDQENRSDRTNPGNQATPCNPGGLSRWRVLSAEFVKSCYRSSDAPSEPLPETAFAGRSNVGKSSLINTLVGQKQLAITSSTPGRTQALNFFLVRLSPDPRPPGFPGIPCHFVDLPGYGYAKVPGQVRRSWRPLVESYIENNSRLRGMILLVDPRRGLGEEEEQLAEYLASMNVALQVVLTKCDKLGRGKALAQGRQISAALQLPPDASPIPFSVVSKEGKSELLSRIGNWINPDGEGNSP